MTRNFICKITPIIGLTLLAAVLLAGCPNKNAGKNSGESGNANTRAGATQRDPAMAAKMSQFRDAHKYTFQLTTMAGKIGRLEEEGTAPLTSAQAKAILAVLKPLRGKATLTQDEAKEALKGVKAVLTEQQLTELGKMKERRRGNRSADGQQRGTNNGQRPRGDRPRFDPDAMKNFNPFNPAKGSPMAGRSAERWNEFFTKLEQKAKG